MEFDDRSAERLRTLPASELLEELRRLAYGSGGGSDVYQELLEEAVAMGWVTWDDVENASSDREL